MFSLPTLAGRKWYVPLVTRDNWLFGVFGALLGFIAGYVLHEAIAARQPPRLPAGAAAVSGENPHAGLTGGEVPPGGPAAANPQAGGAPMAEIQRLRAEVEKNPNDADALLQLANLNYDIKSWQRAADLYERFLVLRPENPDVLTDLGVTLRELGRTADALERFDRAAALAPTHWQSRFNQAVVLGLDMQDYARAEKVLAGLKSLQPDNASVTELAAEIARRKQAGPPTPVTPPKTSGTR